MGESTGPASGAGSRTSTLRTQPVEVPDPATLSVAQTCGRACVWCAVTLSTETAIELGSRSQGGFTWFPRSCRLCAVVAAHKAHLEHSLKCLRCYDNPARCSDGQELRQTLKEARR
ncbi:hypothetical protein GCM10009837_59190 [Streptomyces durmitorensis]